MQEVLIASLLLYSITFRYRHTKQHEIDGIYIYRKKMRKRDLIKISTMAICYMLKGSARGKLEPPAGTEPCRGDHGPRVWPGLSHPPRNGDRDQQRLPDHHQFPQQG